MKILELDLRAFGAFTDVTLDLSAGQEGVHLIYGPNEAGKSTALRAIEQALFGFPAQTADDFLHSYKNLRVGATLATSDGTRLAFLRRKANLNTLLARDNATTLADAALAPFLSGLDREQFRAMYGIDHQQLVQGGREIVHGGGSVGQLLFAAGSGIADLQSVHARLQNDAEELFKPRGKKTINTLLKSYDDARKKAKTAQLPAEKWEQHQQALDGARQGFDRVEVELCQQRSEQARVERLRQALPLLAQRKELQRQRQALGKVVQLPADFAEKRRTAAADLDTASKIHDSARQELERLDAQLGEIIVPEALLAHAAAIKELPEQLGSVRKAQRDLPGLKARREQAETESRRILRQILPAAELSAAESLRLSTLQQVAIRDLGNRHEALVQACRRGQQEIEQLRRQWRQEQAEAEALQEQRSAGPLRELLRRVQKQGDLEARAAEEQQRLDRVQQQAGVELSRLGHWSGGLPELERLAVPSAESVDRFEHELADVQRRLAAGRERQSGLAKELEDVERQIDQLRREGEVPTEEDLREARRVRQLGWQLIHDRWQGRAGQGAGAEREFIERFAPAAELSAADLSAAELSAAYEAAVEKADQCADRLRREAHRAAQLAGCLAERESHQRSTAALNAQLAQLAREMEQAEMSWRACWQPAAIEPRTPREMRAWLLSWLELTRQAELLRVGQTALGELRQRIEALADELRSALAELGEPSGSGAETLAGLLVRSQALVERIEAAAGRREQLLRSVRQLQDKVGVAEQRAKAAEAELADWQQLWAQALEPLGLAAQTTPAAANAVLGQIDTLFAQLRDATEMETRIAGIDRDRETFAGRVRELASRAAPALAERPFEQAADALIAELDRAAAAQQRRELVGKERERFVRQRDTAQAAIDKLTSTLAVMCREAGCSQVDELPRVEQASEQARGLDGRLAELEERLFTLGAGASLVEIEAEAEGQVADSLPERLRQMAARIKELEGQRDQLQRTMGSAEAQLEALRADGGAADAAEEVQDVLARLESETLQYVRLRLAAAILRDGIESYRAKNEGPVLRRASDLFSRFTLSRFERLIVEDAGEGQKVLKGVRIEGALKTVELAGMSEGTADQLFLALRLASIESHLDGRESIPVVLDDILIRFDDERSAAALGALAELSCKTQILFFTHHEHMVELARKTLSPELLFVHRL